MRKVFLILLLCLFSVSVNAQKSKKKRNLVSTEQAIQDSLANTFEHLALRGQSDFLLKAERFIIAKGDSVRFKTVFLPINIEKIEAENGACTTREDLKKGEWIVTLKPEKTKWCSIKVYNKSGTISEVGTRIIVVEPDKYEEVIAQLKKLQGAKKGKYIDDIAGGSFDDFFPSSSFGKRWK